MKVLFCIGTDPWPGYREGLAAVSDSLAVLGPPAGRGQPEHSRCGVVRRRTPRQTPKSTAWTACCGAAWRWRG